jgi:phage shock protein A
MHARSRLKHLLRGVLAQWVRRREKRHPGAVYEAAINERAEQYDALRRAAAGVIYLRGKLDTQLRDARAQLAGVEIRLAAALERDDDTAGLPLVRRREALRAEVQRLTSELAALTDEAEVAKQNLVAFGEDIARLRDEKVRMLARLANARARVRLQRTLNGLSTDADVRALEAVREDIERQAHEAHLGHELGDLDGLRSAEVDAVARAHWEELKRVRRGPLLPMTIPQTAA